MQLDTHAIASQASRGIELADFTNIITYACFISDMLSTIPIGKGAYFQDVNTLISIYLTRLGKDEIRVETVLGPDMHPKQPMFRRPVPPHNMPRSSTVRKTQSSMAKAAQEHGRDFVSQRIADLAPVVVHATTGMNRADRRAFGRFMKKNN